jgi:hypothetical protein
MLSPKRDLTAAKRFLRLALSGVAPSPRVINVDGHPAYPSAIAELKQSGELGRRCRCRTSPYLNNVIEQDHRFIKKRITASLGFRSTEGAWRTIEGYEAMHAIRNRRCRVVLSRDYTLATLVSSAFQYLQQNPAASLQTLGIPLLCQHSPKLSMSGLDRKHLSSRSLASPWSFADGDLRRLFTDSGGIDDEFKRVRVLVLLHQLEVDKPFCPRDGRAAFKPLSRRFKQRGCELVLAVGSQAFDRLHQLTFGDAKIIYQ